MYNIYTSKRRELVKSNATLEECVAMDAENTSRGWPSSLFFVEVSTGKRFDKLELENDKSKPRKRFIKHSDTVPAARAVSEDTGGELPESSERDSELPTVRDIKRDQ